MAWSFNNILPNIKDSAQGASAWWDGVPKEKSDQDFLKNTVFKGQAGFSGNKFSEDAAEKAVESFFVRHFANTPKDKLPKSFSEEEKQAFVKEMLGASYDKASASAKAYLFDKVDDVLDDKYEEEWHTIKASGRWVRDKAAPAVVSGAKGLGSGIVTSAGLVPEVIGWGAGTVLEKAPGAKNIPLIGSALKATADTGLAFYDRRKTNNDFVNFAIENPGRAGSLATQGVVNAGTSTVGFIVDSVVFVGYDVIGKKGIGNALIGGYNLLQDKTSKADYLNTGKWLVTSDWMKENTQFVEKIRPLNSDGTPNKNANNERVFLYGPQAVAEIGVMVIASAATGGVAGAAYATARSGGALTARTVGMLEQVKRVEAVADATQKLSKVTKAEQALSEAKTVRDAVAAQNTVTASQASTATAQAGAQGTAATTSTTVQAGAQTTAATTTTTVQAGAQTTAATTTTTVQAGTNATASTLQSAEEIARAAIEKAAKASKETTQATQTTSQVAGQSSTTTVQASAQGAGTTSTTTVQTTTATAVQPAAATPEAIAQRAIDKAAQATRPPEVIVDRAIKKAAQESKSPKEIVDDAIRNAAEESAGAAPKATQTVSNPALDSANKAVSDAADKLAKAEQKTYTPKFGNQMKAIEKSGVTTQEVVQPTARKLEVARAELEAAQASGKSEAVIQKLSDKVTSLETKITTDAANAARVGAQVAETNGVLAPTQLTGFQNVLETSKIWAHKGARFADPRHGGALGITLEAIGGGGSFAAGYYLDQLDADQKLAFADALISATGSGGTSDILSEEQLAQGEATLAEYKKRAEEARARREAQALQEQPTQTSDNVRPTFNTQSSQGAASATTDGQSNSFNNAASGIVIKIDPAFIQAIREQSLAASTPPQNKNAPL